MFFTPTAAHLPRNIFFTVTQAVPVSSGAATFTACDKGGEEEKPTYTVTFDADGGTPAPAAQKVTEGGKATAPAAMTKAGYTFLHWSKDGAAAYDFATPVTANITLTAKWQDEMLVTEYWQVTWSLGGGAWPVDDDHADEVVRGLELAEPAAPTRAGYTFDGWYKEEALTNKVAFPYSTEGFTANFTLYAKWTAVVVKPVITIDTQPTAPAAALTEGAIPADTKTTVEASVTEGATLTYQWYSNTTASNEGGTAIDGATAASYTMPTTLTEGIYHCFCEVRAGEADPVRTDVVTVTVAAKVAISMTTAISGEVDINLAGSGEAVINLGDGTAPLTVTLTGSMTEYKHIFADAAVRTVTISGENITGLACSGLELTALDVSNSPALTELSCSSNQLTTLDVSKNTALTELDCTANQLTTLDVSKNTALKSLYCAANQLMALDVSKSTGLVSLFCYGNQLTVLDVTKNTALGILWCNGNQLTALDASENTELYALRCHNNQFTAEGLNALFGTLHGNTGDKELYISCNPGTAACDQNIAAGKGWTVTAD